MNWFTTTCIWHIAASDSTDAKTETSTEETQKTEEENQADAEQLMKDLTGSYQELCPVILDDQYKQLWLENSKDMMKIKKSCFPIHTTMQEWKRHVACMSMRAMIKIPVSLLISTLHRIQMIPPITLSYVMIQAVGRSACHGDRNDSSDPDPVSGGTLPVESAETEERIKKEMLISKCRYPICMVR